MSARVLALALRAYPKTRRERDGEVLVATARDLVDDGASSVGREALGLLRGGLSARLGSLRTGWADGPWREVLGRLAVPLAGVALALWSVAYVSLAGLGRCYPVVLAAAALTFAGALARVRSLALAGWLSLCALVAYALAHSYVHDQVGGRFSSAVGPASVDMVAAFAPLTVLGLLTVLGMVGEPRLRDVGWLAPDRLERARGRLDAGMGAALGPPAAARRPVRRAGRGRARMARTERDRYGGPARSRRRSRAAWLSAALPTGMPGALLSMLGVGGASAACVVLLARRAQRSRPEPEPG